MAGRPSLNSRTLEALGAARLAELLERRNPLYAQADLRLEQGEESAEAVAANLLRALPTILREAPAAEPAGEAFEIVDREGRRLETIN